MGKACVIAHPYATILNADSIGDNFSCRYCITLGEKSNGRPQIGNNIIFGAGRVLWSRMFRITVWLLGIRLKLLDIL